MVGVKEKVNAYVRLVRLHSLIASGLACILGACGALAVLEDGWFPSIHTLLVFLNLFFVGFFVHIFGQTLNDFVDLKVDSANPELRTKPLVSGVIGRNEAIVLMVISFSMIWVSSIPLFDSIFSVIVMVLLVGTGITYDLISKKWVHSAFFLAAWGFFMGIFGGVAMGGFASPLDIPLLVFIISLLGGLQMWMNTAILGHLKDVKNDHECGIYTFPIALGVRVGKKGDPPALTIPPAFRFVTIAVQVPNLILAFLPLVFFGAFYAGAGIGTAVVIGAGLSILSALILLAQYKIMWFRTFERGKLMRWMSIREVSAYFLVIVLAYPMVGPVLALVFLVLPLAWFFVVNLIFTKNILQPKI